MSNILYVACICGASTYCLNRSYDLVHPADHSRCFCFAALCILVRLPKWMVGTRLVGGGCLRQPGAKLACSRSPAHLEEISRALRPASSLLLACSAICLYPILRSSLNLILSKTHCHILRNCKSQEKCSHKPHEIQCPANILDPK
jgi:hypothetical protein